MRFLRGPRSRWWRGVLGIALGISAFLGVVFALGTLLIGAVNLVKASDQEWATTIDTFVGLASIAAALPVMLILQRWVFGLRGRWLHSVEGRFRWGLMLRAALIGIVVLALYGVVTAVSSGTTIAPNLSVAAVVGFIGAVVLVPFQAAAEEYLVRGIVARSTGSWLRTPSAALAVSLLLSAITFALLHGKFLPGVMLYYALVGAALWTVAWQTGGLEAAVAIHGTINLVGFGQSFLFAQAPATSDTITAAEQFETLWGLIPVMVATAIVIWWFRRLGVRRTYAAEEVRGDEIG